jgi:YD repeat-containing protein
LDVVASRTDANNLVTEFGYNLRGERTWLLDASQNKTEFTYDDADRLTVQKDPLGAETFYS